MGGFTVASSPSPLASEDESDDGFGSDNANEDDDVGSPVVMRCLLDILAFCHS